MKLNKISVPLFLLLSLLMLPERVSYWLEKKFFVKARQLKAKSFDNDVFNNQAFLLKALVNLMYLMSILYLLVKLFYASIEYYKHTLLL